eukprot:jgi/Chrzof1/6075/Cz17g08010.t1
MMSYRTGPADALPTIFKTGIDDATARNLADKARVFLNDCLALLARILSGTDVALSVRTAAILWVVGYVGRFITPVGMLYTVVVLLFTLPKLYEMRKDDVDRGVELARQNLATNYETVKGKVNEAVARFTPRKGARPVKEE